MAMLSARRGVLASAVGAAADVEPTPESYAEEVVADGPLGFWRFEETSGTTAADEMESQDGTYVDTPDLTVAGIEPDTTAMGSVGSTAAMTLPALSAWNQVAFTVEAWIATINDTAIQTIACRDEGAGGTRRWTFRVDDGVLVALVWVSGTSPDTDLQGTISVADGEWHHVVLTVNDTEVKLYVDGVLDADAVPSDAPGSATLGMVCGREIGDALPFDGAIDEFAFYDHVLSLTRIQAHFNAADPPAREPAADPSELGDLWAWFDASQESYSNGDPVPVWADRSGNDRHAEQATSGSQPIFRTAGLAGMRCLDFTTDLRFLDLDTPAISLRPATIFAVVEWTGSGDTQLLAGTSGDGATAIDWFFGQQRLLREGTALVGEANSTLQADTPHMIDVRWDSTGSVFGFDGDDDGTGGGGSSPNSRVPRIGRRSGTKSSGLNAKAGELIIYNRRLFPVEVAEVRTYLANKWGFAS